MLRCARVRVGVISRGDLTVPGDTACVDPCSYSSKNIHPSHHQKLECTKIMTAIMR